jgi:tRNA threonylcarbamoyladenosine biosynthesis protein TsaE
MSRIFSKEITGEEAMVQFGESLGHSLCITPSDSVSTDISGGLANGALIFFDGDLGAGKTTLCRGVLQAFGHKGAVKSPTYTLVETYVLGAGTVQLHHFDLYRLGDPEELEFIGIRDYLQPGNYCLIEWPNRGAGILPIPDLKVNIGVTKVGRDVKITAETEVGEFMLSQLAERERT